MADFSDEDKKERSNNYFEEGVHEVKIAVVAFDKTADGKEFAEFTVMGKDADDSRSGTARVWFTTPEAKNYAFNIIRGIFVHNAPDDKKDAVRDSINKIKNTEELEKACEKLIEKEAWYLVQKSDRTYTNSNGETKNSYNRDIYGYKPAPKNLTVQPDVEGAEEVDQSEIPF